MIPDIANLVHFPPQDRESLFLLYVAHCGDVKATAEDAGVEESLVQRFVEKFRWDKLLSPIKALRKSQTPGDTERAINRAINFAQAHRLRLVLQRVLEYYLSLNTDQLTSALTLTRDSKDSFLRDLANLVSLLDKAHHLTYAALGDSPVERKDRAKETPKEQHSVLTLETKLATALSSALANDSPEAKAMDAELRDAQNERDNTVSSD